MNDDTKIFSLNDVNKESEKISEALCDLFGAMGWNIGVFFDGDDGIDNLGIIETMTDKVKEAGIRFDLDWIREEYPSAEM